MPRPAAVDIYPLRDKRLRLRDPDFDDRLQKVLEQIEAHQHAAGDGGWDAIVDESFPESDPEKGLFKNSPGEALSYLDSIGLDRALVLVRDGTYTETANWTAPPDVVLFSAAQGAGSVVWNHGVFTCSWGSLALYGLRTTFGAKQTGFTLASTGYFSAYESVFECLNLTGTTLAALVAGNYCHYDSCTVDRMCSLGNYVWVRDMEVLPRPTSGDCTVAQNWIVGNFMLGSSSGTARNWNMPAHTDITIDRNNNIRLASGSFSAGITLVRSSPDKFWVRCKTSSVSVNLTGTPAGTVRLEGVFSDITTAAFSAASSESGLQMDVLCGALTVAAAGQYAHSIRARCSGNVDITGQAIVDLWLESDNSCILRGQVDGVVGSEGYTGSGTFLTKTSGASNLLVRAGGGSAGVGARPYNLDATSSHNFILWPNLASWATPGIDSGSNNRIETTPGPGITGLASGPPVSEKLFAQAVVTGSGTLAAFANHSHGTPDNVVYTRTAGAAVSTHRVCTVQNDGEMEHADHTTASHLERPLYLSLGAVAGGASGPFCAFGEVTEAGWAWTPGEALYLGANGVLTQTPPTNPGEHVREVGKVLTPTRILFDPQPALVLA